MDDNDFDYLKSKMKDEGFHYCFKSYSRFEHIKDEEFHKLRLEYLDAAKKLEEYILSKTSD